MKARSLKSETRLARTELLEVLDGLWDGGSIQAHFNAPSSLTIDIDIKEDSLSYFSIGLSKKCGQQTIKHRELGRRSDADGLSDVGLSGRKGLAETEDTGDEKESSDHHCGVFEVPFGRWAGIDWVNTKV